MFVCVGRGVAAREKGCLSSRGATVGALERKKLSPGKNQNEIFMFPAKVSIWLDFKGRLTEKQETKGKNQVGCD